MCVRSASLHGLPATGVTSQRLHRRFVAHIRRIAKSPSYMTHESTEALCLRLGIEIPCMHLQETWQQQYDRLHATWQGLSSDDFLRTFDLHKHQHHVMQTFVKQDRPQFVDVHLCPFSTLYQSQLIKHLQKAHAVAPLVHKFVPLRDALAGHPQCSHCGNRFADRAGIQRHIQKNRCVYFEANRSCQAYLADHPDLRAMATANDWSPLWTNDALLSQLKPSISLTQGPPP